MARGALVELLACTRGRGKYHQQMQLAKQTHSADEAPLHTLPPVDLVRPAAGNTWARHTKVATGSWLPMNLLVCCADEDCAYQRAGGAAARGCDVQ
jgi:hypothetical protein